VLKRLVVQARLQKSSETKSVPDFLVVLPAENGRGLVALPEPDEGDVFYDIEGHPYFGVNGLEYLHGIATVDGGQFRFRGEWAHSSAAEQNVFESFVDFLIERWNKYPGMHVYHYAPYETTALKRLMGQYGTRELEIDAMLRGNLFVDLYRVVRQGVRIGVASYSIKKLEPLYMSARQGKIVMASSSIIEYERWLQSGDQKILDAILLYNKEDVESAWHLRNWLEARRTEVVNQQGEMPRGPLVSPEGALKIDTDLQNLVDQLNQGRPVGIGP
jgi:predicted RecB family nuclease